MKIFVDQVELAMVGLSGRKVSRIKLELVEVIREAERDEFSNGTQTGGDVDQLLDKFCSYQAARGGRNRWDLSLLLTGRDLYSEEEAEAGGRSMLGISVLQGLQQAPELACSLVELGAPLEAGGLLEWPSVWVTAHEIGHSLGIHHDGLPFNGDCPPNGWIMSAEAPTKRTNLGWSRCSRESLDLLDLERLLARREGSEGSWGSSS